jgi:peptidoglycan/LPS O-acetylase OafA/YrhL
VRDTQLDGLRGIAAFGVVWFHAYYGALFSWMWTFVDLFFVLSGFLITRLVLQALVRDNFSLRNFMIRRALRIWPIYYLLLAFCSFVVVVNYVATGDWRHTDGLLSAPFFLQYTHHYLAPGFHGADDQFIFWFHHSWSIAIEEQFYLLMPLLLMFCKAAPCRCPRSDLSVDTTGSIFPHRRCLSLATHIPNGRPLHWRCHCLLLALLKKFNQPMALTQAIYCWHWTNRTGAYRRP